jgi:hypothetical protein
MCLPSDCKHPQRRQNSFHTLHMCQSFRRYCKNKFFELTKIFCFNVKETHRGFSNNYFQNLKSRYCCNVYNGLRQKEIQKYPSRE